MGVNHFHISVVKAQTILAILSILILLTACSEPRPDGHVYQMNGAGMTLPAAGAEIAFIPGTSRADFFYGPLSEAYDYATADLGTELIPVCEQAKTLLAALQDQNDASLNELKAGGDLPATPDACFNMCTQRVGLEEQRGQDREQLGKTIARLNTQIVNAQEKIKDLEASRSEKAGELGRRLARLESARDNQLSQRAKVLRDEQVSKISFRIGGSVKYDSGERVRVTLVNGSDYALVKSSYGTGIPILAGYYKGKVIVEQKISIPHYVADKSNLKDEFGFDRGYIVALGASIVIGDTSIYDFPGLSVSSPEGRLLAREEGWTPNAQGYVLPDEIRIKDFPSDLFVIPDKDGTRTGSTITYSPKQVDFQAEAAAKGLPQDAEISRMKRQIDSQSYPEDSQIKEQNALIASLDKEKKQVTDGFNNSAIASQISQLNASESSCRMARDLSNGFEKERLKLSGIRANLSSCSAENLTATAIFTGVSELNNAYAADIDTPDISTRYRLKASALVMTKLSQDITKTALTGVDGGYSFIDGIDPSSSLGLVSWRSGFGEAFWFQPLANLGERKDLTHTTAENGSFEDFVDNVIRYGMGVTSVDELSTRLMVTGYHEDSPFSMKSGFEGLAEAATQELLAAELVPAADGEESEVPNEVPLSCEP